MICPPTDALRRKVIRPVTPEQKHRNGDKKHEVRGNSSSIISGKYMLQKLSTACAPVSSYLPESDRCMIYVFKIVPVKLFPGFTNF